LILAEAQIFIGQANTLLFTTTDVCVDECL